MIVEGLVTTCNDDGTVNLSPMGPRVDDAWLSLQLRPFRTSTTYANLARHRQGVFHITDDVELLSRAAVKRLEPLPELRPCPACEGWVIADCCRWYAFRVDAVDDRHERSEIAAHVVASGRQRDFLGFNRAKHAVLEAAILATRVGLLDPAFLQQEMSRLQAPVEKTGGAAECRALEFLMQYVRECSKAGAATPQGAEGRS